MGIDKILVNLLGRTAKSFQLQYQVMHPTFKKMGYESYRMTVVTVKSHFDTGLGTQN